MSAGPSRLLTRLLAGAASALLLSGGLLLTSPTPARAADCAEDPVTAIRGAEPLCDSPNGRTFTLDVDQAEPGQTIGFSGTGFVRDAGGGQTLTLKFNDIDIIAARVEADADGNVSGQVTLPSAEVFDAYTAQYGADRWWIRVLVGSGRADGADDAPSASVHDEFTVPAAGGGDDGGAGGADGGDGGTDTGGDTGTDGDTDTDTDAGEGAGTGSGTTGKGSGTLPDTGLGDHPGLVTGGLLAALAVGLLALERRFRRRTAV